jgi:hypothetical protein
MKLISNIRDLKIMYITTSIGIISYEIGSKFNLNYAFNSKDNSSEIVHANMYIYSFILSKYGGTAHIQFNNNKFHYFLKLNEILFDNFDNENKIQNEFNKLIANYEKSEFVLDMFNLNSIKILTNKGKKNEYYSLLFLAVPYAIKINDKNKLIKDLKSFIDKYTDDSIHILSTITCGLFINYALNNIPISKWIELISIDLKEINDSEKYIDYLNNYYEDNFRKNEFIEKEMHYIVDVRNESFVQNYGNKNNKILSEKPSENIILILDTLLRSRENWEKLILFGLTNFNDNISIGLVLGVLYEIVFSTKQVNKNLIKRFSF